MAEQAPQTTAVVVTYQSERTIREAMWAAQRARDRHLLDCIVVDNGSSDATAAILARDFAWARVMLTGTNNGFGRGCNIGLAQVSTPYTIFINPDAVVEPEAIESMLAFLERHPRAGIVGPAIIEGEMGGAHALQETGERMTPGAQVRAVIPFIRRRSSTRPIVPGAPAKRTGWVCGAVLMVRTDLMKQLGGFDPRFFLYWEETDLCKRVEDLGFEVWALGEAVAHHVGGASSSSADGTRIGGCIAKHYFQSRYYYMRKHHGWLAATSAEALEFALLSIRTVADLARGRGAGWFRSRMQTPLFSQPERV